MHDKDSDEITESSRSGRPWRVESYVVWRGRHRFSPPTDVVELVDRLMIQVEIAGMRAGDFNVVLLDQRVIITGKRDQPALPHVAYHQVEIGYGEFRVEIQLPWSVDRDQVGASYRDGFLLIELPRLVETRIHIVDAQADEFKQQE
jgi:HSP20 family molecular chaperone IbpA